ncbi:MAG: hypothetical protein MZV64_44825 [Ignavibacteriales bacterium]|nr:hypothetical protein [Ignavibacteriales bacterium]
MLNDGRLRIERRFQIRRKPDGADAGARADPLRLHRPADRASAKRMPEEFTTYTSWRPRWRRPLRAETEPYQPGVEPS